MKFYKLVNNNWVETGRVENHGLHAYNIDRIAYKLGYVRILSQQSRRATYNFYYKTDCAKAKSPLTAYYFDDRYRYLNGSDDADIMYFSCRQSTLDNYTNDELYNIYKLTRCEDCGQLVNPRDAIKVGRKHVFCKDCVTKHAKKCYICGTWYMKASSVTEYNIVERSEPIHVCNHCKAVFERTARVCADCGRLTYNPFRLRNNFYCRDCYSSHDVPNLINGYHCGTMPIVKQFATTETFKDDAFVCGTEIETECPESVEPRFVAFDINEIMNKENQLCKFERDSSLRHGVEIITQPGTPDWYYETSAKFKDFFNTLQSYNCADTNEYGTPTCGLHIHVNRSFFKDYDYENRLCYLFQRLKDKIRNFSRRTRFDYCAFATGTTSWDNIFIQKVNQMQGHGSALNCSNRNTIEFRIFRGTTDYNQYMACVEFTRNFCTLVRDTTDIAQIERTTFDDVINYCDNKFLNAYCERLGLLGGAC